MWLSRLDLLAFGRFTNVKLELGPGFHLVYGPNEAGKSTTLRAIRQLLFGFDERTTDNFVHANTNLRIGGVVCGETGMTLEVIRRKTRKDSLRAADDISPIDPDLWEGLLCGIDEATFSNRYGIDYEQLIQGGHEIATGSGDLGEILFATGSGVMDLTAVQKQLNDEAAELFKPTGKKQRLNQAIIDWQLQREQVVEKQLSVSAWEEADRLRQEVQARLDEISSKWSLQIREVDRYQRWQKAWPLVQEQNALDQQLAKFATVHQLPADFGKKRQEAILLLKQGEAQEQTALDALRQVQQELDPLKIPEALLARDEYLNRLFTDFGSILKAQHDRTKLVEQRDLHRKALDKLILESNRLAPDLPLHGITLDRTQRTRINQLGRQHAGLTEALQQTEVRQERLQQQIRDLQQTQAKTSAPKELGGLRDAVKQTRFDGDLESQLSKVHNEITELEQLARSQREQLGLWKGSLDDLRSMRVPTTEVVNQWETTFQANLTERSHLKARLIEIELEHKRLTQQIESFVKEFQVPTEADLEKARESRRTIWVGIRETISSKKNPSAASIKKFEQSLTAADQLADRLRNEADRVAQLAEQAADLKTNAHRQHEISLRLAELEATRIDIERAWQKEWPDFDAVPFSPQEMMLWITRRDLLLQNDAQLSRRRTEAAALLERIDARRGLLSQLMAVDSLTESGSISDPSLALTPVAQEPVARSEPSGTGLQLSFGWEIDSTTQSPPDDERVSEFRREATRSLSDLLELAEERLALNEETTQSQRTSTQSLERLTGENTESLIQLQRAKDELKEWQTDWQDAIADLRLASDSSPDFVAAYVESLFETLDHQRQVEQLEGRIQGIDADAERFGSSLKALCQEITPDLTDLTPAQTIAALRTRLSTSQRDQIRWNELTARKVLGEQQVVQARESRHRGEALLAELCHAANVHRFVDESSGDQNAKPLALLLKEMDDVEQRSQGRSLCEASLERVRNRLSELAGEDPAADFLVQVRAQSPTVLAERLKELEHESSQLAAERDRLNHQLGGLDQQLRQMAGGGDAADAEEKQRQTLAQIRSDAEQYVRVKLASSVLHSAIERYRDKIRGPVLSVASDLFRELTLDSFDGLRVDEDDHNRPVLVGLRAGGRDAIGVGGMSEGTCDQLYLALRLASLRLESAPRSHLPFIVDDILIQFDDARAAAALRVLSRLGQERQVIFFTHHEHLLEVASKQLPDGFSAHRLVDC